MLKLEDVFSFQDAIGRIYTAAEMLDILPCGDMIYAVAGEPDRVFVRLEELNGLLDQTIRLMSHSTSLTDGMDRILWPDLRCSWLNDQELCGFLAYRIPGLGSMTPLDEWMDRCLPLEGKQAMAVGRSLIGCIRQVYGTAAGYVLGRFHRRDFAVDAVGNVRMVNTWRCGHLAPEDQRLSPPELLDCTGETPRFNDMHDSFQFALILFELLTGVPAFGGHEPEADFSDREIRAMIANGESIYYYDHLPQCAKVIQALEGDFPEVAGLLRRTFDYSDWVDYTQCRPAMAEWFDALDGTDSGKIKIEEQVVHKNGTK